MFDGAKATVDDAMRVARRLEYLRFMFGCSNSVLLRRNVEFGLKPLIVRDDDDDDDARGDGR